MLCAGTKNASKPIHLVDSGIGKRVDDVGTIEQTTVESNSTAQGAAALDDVVVTLEVRLLDAAQGRTAFTPLISTVSRVSESGASLTVVAAGDAAALLAGLAGAGVLLQAGVGDAARAVGDGAVVVLARGDGVARGDGGGGDEGGEAEDSGGESELHVGGFGGVEVLLGELVKS